MKVWPRAQDERKRRLKVVTHARNLEERSGMRRIPNQVQPYFFPASNPLARDSAYLK